MNNINQMGSQWRTLQPQSPSDIGFLSNGSGGGGGAFQRPARQITKNPQNMFQNFPPSQSQVARFNFLKRKCSRLNTFVQSE